jgi:hypothetical protein
MLKSLSISILTFFITSFCFSQNPDNWVENKYLEYFNLNHETIYTHINKTKFLNSEELWFKSYIYNTKTLKPYLSTTNVYASIYDAQGNLIEKKIYYAEDGKTNGNFSLKTNHPPGIYFLKVTTNWMKNFNEQHYSLIQFEVLGESFMEPLVKEQKYDFQLLPEGGHLLENTNNSIGFKAVDFNEKPIKINSGKILNSKGDILSNFKSNQFGLGRFSVFIKENETYKVEITLEDGTTISKNIPKAETTGLALTVNNLNDKALFISIKTNKRTLPNLTKTPHYLLIHRDGLLKRIDLKFEADKYEYTLAIPKTDLYRGMNILTLFNDKNQPVLERLVFNKAEDLIHQISFLGQNTRLDSTQIRLASKKKSSFKKTISISVLPASTKAYNKDNTIISAFFLKPYIKGHIDNPNYYFNDNSRKTNYDLDLLLLTQGWSSYNWKNIFHRPQIAKHNFEAGFQIQGKINSSDIGKFKEIVLFSANNELLLTSEIKDSYFSFENLSLMDSSVVSISAKNKKGKLVTPKSYFNIYPTYQRDSINSSKFLKTNSKKENLININENFIYDDSVTELDTVMLSLNIKEKKEKFMINGGVNNKAVDLENGYSFSTRVIDVIRNNGFDVIENGRDIKILSRRASNLSGRLSANVFLDGIIVSDFLESIQFLTINDIDELYVARTGFGMNGAGGTINIFTREGGSIKKNNKSNFNNNKIKIGFSMAKSYYSPLYDRNKRETFSEIGVLNWIPNLQPNRNGEFIFKIPNYFYKSVNLYIEGMCEDGSLISKIETIKID